MTPKKIATRSATLAEARSRLQIGKKYLEAADLLAAEDGASVNVSIGVAVLAGIAAADTICVSALNERYSGPDHQAAVTLLSRVDAALGKRLARLIRLKSDSQYRAGLLSDHDRTIALREARALVTEAERRLIA